MQKILPKGTRIITSYECDVSLLLVCCFNWLTNTTPRWFNFLIKKFVLSFIASRSYFFFLQSQSRSQAEARTQAFLKNSLQHSKEHDVSSLLSYKAVMLEYSRPKKEKLKRKSKGASRINACQKRKMEIFKIKPEHQRWVSSVKPPTASDCGKTPPIPLSPLYITLQIWAFPPPAWALETVHHWLVWWPETYKVNESKETWLTVK